MSLFMSRFEFYSNIVACPAIIIMIWAIAKSVITTPLGDYDLGLDPMSEVMPSK